jgi:cyanobactin maturation PatA/PatG family protease
VINVSGGEFSPSGTAHPLLADAVAYCAKNDVLIVAAAGNEGCECLHIPSALPSVLAVGAMDAEGRPMEFSNWAELYRTSGVLALGEHIVGASPFGGTVAYSGTSFATAVVSGVVALLLSLQLKQGRSPDAHAVRMAILESASRDFSNASDRFGRASAGRLNIAGAVELVTQGEFTMSDEIAENGHSEESEHGVAGSRAVPVVERSPERLTSYENGIEQRTAPRLPKEITAPTRAAVERPQQEPMPAKPASCGCGCSGSPQLVYALGQLGFDFGSEARRDSIVQHMAPGGNPHDPQQLLGYLKENPWDAASIIWTLNVEATPVYAVQPAGPFAREICQRLCDFLSQQIHEGVERVSVPGKIAGKAKLLNGQVVPTIAPELRGMYSWTTGALVEAVCGTAPKSARNGQRQHAEKTQAVGNFLDRVYHESRNLGLTAQDRAINYAATNALNIERVYESAMKEAMDLESIDVERSPVCRPDSDCWDVKLLFFFPQRQVQTVRKAYRFTVDVSDVVPVMVGKMRSWYVR